MKNLLQISKLSKNFGPQVVLDEVSFNIRERQKMAVIGRNGAGKSTLFNIICSLEKQDSGEVIVLPQTRIGYLKQEDDFVTGETVIQYLIRKTDKEEWQCAKMAARFELKADLLSKAVLELSGGYQMRVKLTLMLLSEPNLILLDEPTNYLDLSTIILLEKFLQEYNGAYLVISHDRRFIRKTCHEILELERGRAFHYSGPLEEYLEFKIQQKESDEKFNRKQEERRKHLQRFIDRFGAKASKASQAKAKAKQIDRLEFKELQNSLSNVVIKSPAALSEKGFCWRMEDLVIGYPDREVASDISIDIEKGEHVAILGDNGQGKTTFMKVLAGELKPTSGVLKPANNLKIGYYAQHVATQMNCKETVEQYLERTSDHQHTVEEIYKMAGNFLFKDEDIKKPISVLSGGEKSRLALAGLLLNKYDVLLLDEPTNHLDFETAEALAFALADSKVTVLFITHDRTFVNILANRILKVGDHKVKHFYGELTDYIDSLFGSAVSLEPAFKRVAKVKKINDYEEEKKKSREIVKIEQRIDKLRQEKEKLIRYFNNNPISPSQSKIKRMKFVEKQIEENEQEWYKLVD